MELKTKNSSFSALTKYIQKVSSCSMVFSPIYAQQRQYRSIAVLHPEEQATLNWEQQA